MVSDDWTRKLLFGGIHSRIKIKTLFKIENGKIINELNIVGNKLFIFSLESELRKAIISDCDVPTSFEELRDWLPKQKSKFGDGNIEGVVWHILSDDGRFTTNLDSMVKIKTNNFYNKEGLLISSYM